MSKFLKKGQNKLEKPESNRLPEYMYRGHWVSDDLLFLYDKERIDYSQKRGNSYWVNKAERIPVSASYLRRNPIDQEPEIAKLPPPEPLVYKPKVTYKINRKDKFRKL